MKVGNPLDREGAVTTLEHHVNWYFAFLLSLLFGLGATLAFAQAFAQDGYVGVVSQSTIYDREAQFTFANIQRSRPFVVWPNGDGREVAKLFEDDGAIVLIFVAASGGTETFHLNKRASRFTIIEVSFLLSGNADVDPVITHGALK